MALATIFFLCWGSFLGVIGYRIIRKRAPLGRSFCPDCYATLPWYDLVPVFSWILLRGTCRFCNHTISTLYPTVEVITAITMLLLYIAIPSTYFISYFIFYSLLLIMVYTDLEQMLIPTIIPLIGAPIGIGFSFIDFLPISVNDAIIGTVVGYALPAIINKAFFFITKRDGIGSGDFDTLALIGSFLGLAGCFSTLFIGSFLGATYSIIGLFRGTRKRTDPIPFVPFLTLAALLYTIITTSTYNNEPLFKIITNYTNNIIFVN